MYNSKVKAHMRFSDEESFFTIVKATDNHLLESAVYDYWERVLLQRKYGAGQVALYFLHDEINSVSRIAMVEYYNLFRKPLSLLMKLNIGGYNNINAPQEYGLAHLFEINGVETNSDQLSFDDLTRLQRNMINLVMNKKMTAVPTQGWAQWEEKINNAIDKLAWGELVEHSWGEANLGIHT